LVGRDVLVELTGVATIMPTVIDCPDCSRRLVVPDELADRKVRCPTCGSTFEAQAALQQPEPSSTREEAPAPPVPSQEDGERRPCPYCKELIRVEASRCRYCGEEFEEEDVPQPRRRRVRRDCEPHRATLVLVLGIISLVVGFVGFFTGLAAWIMGSADLKKMDAGEMDPSGKGTTQAGKVCGIIGTIFQGMMLLFVAGMIGLGSYMAITSPPPTRSAPRSVQPGQPGQPVQPGRP
jgi:predicted Zn finger-like uncharacterized protein